MVQNIIKHAEKIKEKSKVASAFCGSQTFIKHTSVTDDRNRVPFNCMDGSKKKNTAKIFQNTIKFTLSV
jgi:hypothetical protein